MRSRTPIKSQLGVLRNSLDGSAHPEKTAAIAALNDLISDLDDSWTTGKNTDDFERTTDDLTNAKKINEILIELEATTPATLTPSTKEKIKQVKKTLLALELKLSNDIFPATLTQLNAVFSTLNPSGSFPAAVIETKTSLEFLYNPNLLLSNSAAANVISAINSFIAIRKGMPETTPTEKNAKTKALGFALDHINKTIQKDPKLIDNTIATFDARDKINTYLVSAEKFVSLCNPTVILENNLQKLGNHFSKWLPESLKLNISSDLEEEEETEAENILVKDFANQLKNIKLDPTKVYGDDEASLNTTLSDLNHCFEEKPINAESIKQKLIELHLGLTLIDTTLDHVTGLRKTISAFSDLSNKLFPRSDDPEARATAIKHFQNQSTCQRVLSALADIKDLNDNLALKNLIEILGDIRLDEGSDSSFEARDPYPPHPELRNALLAFQKAVKELHEAKTEEETTVAELRMAKENLYKSIKTLLSLDQIQYNAPLKTLLRSFGGLQVTPDILKKDYTDSLDIFLSRNNNAEFLATLTAAQQKSLSEFLQTITHLHNTNFPENVDTLALARKLQNEYSTIIASATDVHKNILQNDLRILLNNFVAQKQKGQKETVTTFQVTTKRVEINGDVNAIYNRYRNPAALDSATVAPGSIASISGASPSALTLNAMEKLTANSNQCYVQTTNHSEPAKQAVFIQRCDEHGQYRSDLVKLPNHLDTLAIWESLIPSGASDDLKKKVLKVYKTLEPNLLKQENIIFELVNQGLAPADFATTFADQYLKKVAAQTTQKVTLDNGWFSRKKEVVIPSDDFIQVEITQLANYISQHPGERLTISSNGPPREAAKLLLMIAQNLNLRPDYNNVSVSEDEQKAFNHLIEKDKLSSSPKFKELHDMRARLAVAERLTARP